MTRPFFHLLLINLFIMITSVRAQENKQYIRIAKIVVDSASLENYKAALKKGMASAVRLEKGVLSLYAVYDSLHPTHITVFEIYKDVDAYKAHTQTPHFKAYKSKVQSMVKSLELTDVIPIALESKQHMH